MKNEICARETAVLTAARSGDWSEELRRHASDCRACSEALFVERLLVAEATENLPALSALPDPGVIWHSARPQVRQRQLERATWPIRLVEKLSLACGAVALAAGTKLAWPLVQPLVGRWAVLFAGIWSRPTDLTATTVLPMLVASILFLALYGLYTEWVEA
jgi:hypothetical protein